MTPEQLRLLVQEFEAARLPRERWTHEAHLTVAAWYLIHHPRAVALSRMRDGIQRLNASHNVPQTPTGGYHETLTNLYVWLIAEALTHVDADLPVDAKVARVILACADRELPLRYYSRERLTSWEARTSWVPPDLKPIAPPVDFESPPAARLDGEAVRARPSR